jgi:hypothetical protein
LLKNNIFVVIIFFEMWDDFMMSSVFLGLTECQWQCTQYVVLQNSLSQIHMQIYKLCLPKIIQI